MTISINDSVNGAYESSEFFSGDGTLVQSLSNLHLGYRQNSNRCKDCGLSNGYVRDPIWGLRQDGFFNGWKCKGECGGGGGGGVGNGGNLSCMKDFVNVDLMSSRESSDLALRSSSFFNLKNSCIDDLWECVSQEKRPCSWKGKDWFFNNGSVSFYSYGQQQGVSDFDQGANYLCPMSMLDFADESVVSEEEESVNQYLKSNEVVFVSSSKEGSQYLQNVLSVGDEEITNIVFDGVYENVYELMMDPYGQFLFQKIFDVCSVSQQEKLVVKMVSDQTAFIFSAKNQHGSHSLQKLVKKLKGSHFVKLIASSLALDLKSLMISQYGKHVIQQCFIILDGQKCQALYEALLGCCIELATDVVGCSALNNSINNINGAYRDRLLNILVENSAFLSQDPSGNFVLQYILSLRNPTLSKKICYNLQGQFVHLSLHKSGSHLVEKCLKSPGMEYVIRDLLANQKQLLQLARDHFGNYVLQTAIRVTRSHDSKMHQYLLQALEPHIPSIKHPLNGRNVFNVINSCVPLPIWAREKSSLSSSRLDSSGENAGGPFSNFRHTAAV